MRWQKFATHGAARGWAFDVITLDPAALEATDPSLFEQLPAGTRVFAVDSPRLAVEHLEHAIWRVYRWLWPRSPRDDGSVAARQDIGSERSDSTHRDELAFHPLEVRSWLRAYRAWIECVKTRIWAHRAASLGRRLIVPGIHRAVVSSGPPHMAHEGARQFSVATNLPLVIDLRDPWSLFERLPKDRASPVWHRYAMRYEPLAVRRAALTVMNSEPARRAMAAQHPMQADRIIAVTNGPDLDESVPTAARDDRFLIGFAGSVYLDRSPQLLFEAAGRVVRQLELSPADFGIEMMGHHLTGRDGDRIWAMANRAGLEEFLRLHPPGTRRQASEFLARGTMLVSLAQDSHLSIPSKIFEYMRYDAWLLALAEPESSTELLLRETDADVVSPGDIEGLAEVLRLRYAEYRAGHRPEPIARVPRFGRLAQAELLFDAIEQQIEYAPGVQPASGRS